MQSPASLPRFVRYFLAVLLAVIATAYSVLWIVSVRRWAPQVGFTSYQYSPSTHSVTVGAVHAGTTAERAGLRPGDKIVAIDGELLNTLRPFFEVIVIGQKETIELTVEDASLPGKVRRIRLVRRHQEPGPKQSSRLERLLGLPIDYYPLGFLVIGLGVLMLRPDDRNAWLLALMFGGFTTGGPLVEVAIPAQLRGFAVFYKIIMSWTPVALFYYFFSVFPCPSPLDRRVPWLKHLLLATAILVSVPVGLRCLVAGGSLPLYLNTFWPGTTMLRFVLAAQAGLPAPTWNWPGYAVLFFGFFLGAMALGLGSLISNAVLSTDAQAKRKARVMVWGTVVGVVPVSVLATVTFVGGMDTPVAVWDVGVLFLSFVWPLSFAYAVVKHRVLEIPVLLKRSARYVLAQRGFTILLLALWVAAVRVFSHAISGLAGTHSDAVLVLALVFGIGLVWVSAPTVRRVTKRIDRAFFRSAYDAREILESLVEETRTVTSREELAILLGGEIKQALHPVFALVYLADRDGQLRVYPGTRKPEQVDAGLPLLSELMRRKEPWQISDVNPREQRLREDLVIFAPNHPECLVPILTRSGNLAGLLVLGAKLSEETYSHEDLRLVSAVAAQAGVTLENVRLAEDMAERLETERRTARDMEIAKQVQARLFPQKLPRLDTLDYAGRCIQARDVGGDYYDFLNLGVGRIGIVLADIVGKGIPGALLMANLQADVRSQSAIASQDLPEFLKSVNQSFFESTEDGRFATLFFGDYQDCTRRLRFANCGHNPPLLVHPDGTAERLASTATVLGLFEKWESSLGEVRIATDDVLVIYTDGVTEAENSDGEEFGENRLERIIHDHLCAPVSQILEEILQAAMQFSGGEGKMRDDLTLVVARGR